MRNDENIPAVVSMKIMARMLNLSRARFYMLIADGTFLPPVYSLDKRKPYYLADMAKQNLEAKRNNTGINGKVVIFYTARDTTFTAPRQKPKKQEQQSNEKHSELIVALKSLGLADVTAAKVESAIAACFPNGTENVEEAERLRTVFRYLKQKNTTDNVKR